MIGENMRLLRKSNGMSQQELADRLGVSARSLIRYESGERIPDAEFAGRIAEVFGVPVGELYGSGDEFVCDAGRLYGPRGKQQARRCIKQTEALFAGGELSDSDKEAFFKAITEIYWESKERAKKKYSPKKYSGSDAD